MKVDELPPGVRKALGAMDAPAAVFALAEVNPPAEPGAVYIIKVNEDLLRVFQKGVRMRFRVSYFETVYGPGIVMYGDISQKGQTEVLSRVRAILNPDNPYNAQVAQVLLMSLNS